MSSKKIWQYPEATSITNDDYILMDSNTETGSQCLKANKIGAVHITKTVTERKVYKASDDNANGFSEVTVAVPYTDVHYDKDDIVSFVGEDLPLKSVTAYIEPQQDLHGYDAPWVGGAGKNKFDIGETSDWASGGGVTLNISNEIMTISVIGAGGTYTYNNNMQFEGNKSYAISYVASASNSPRVYIRLRKLDNSDWMTESDVTISGWLYNAVYKGWYKDGTTLNPSFVVNIPNCLYWQLGVGYTSENSGTSQTISKIQVEEGSTATTFAPYSNICPISGWDEGNVNVRGVNVWDEEWINGYYNQGQLVFAQDAICCKNKISVNPNTNIYYVKDFDTVTNFYYTFYDINGNFLPLSGYDASGRFAKTTSGVISVPSGAYYMTFNMGAAYGRTYNNDISINYPSTDTSYHAYNGSTITIPFQDAQGNPIEVYGGKLDVVSGGEQPNKYVKKTLYDAWSVASNGVFYLDGKATDGKVGAVNTEADVLCDIYPKGICVGATSGAIQNPKTLCIQDLNGIRFMVYDTSFESLEDFNEYVAQNGIEIRYELATPSTFYTQPTSISSQSGVNNIGADCGPVAVEWQTLYVTPTT